jgi:hypothetical protein
VNLGLLYEARGGETVADLAIQFFTSVDRVLESNPDFVDRYLYVCENVRECESKREWLCIRGFHVPGYLERFDDQVLSHADPVASKRRRHALWCLTTKCASSPLSARC